MKMPSALRPKRRYVGFALHSDGKVPRGEVIRTLWREVLNFLGEERASTLNLWLMDFDEGAGRGFFRVAHTKVGELKGCLALIGEVNGSGACLEVLGVSGTVDGLKRKFFKKERGFAEEGGELEFHGWRMRAARSFEGCIDAVPEDRGLLARLEREKLTYIGLMKEDLINPP